MAKYTFRFFLLFWYTNKYKEIRNFANVFASNFKIEFSQVHYDFPPSLILFFSLFMSYKKKEDKHEITYWFAKGESYMNEANLDNK